MNKTFNVGTYFYMTSRVYGNIELNPKDYLDCNTPVDVIDALYEELYPHMGVEDNEEVDTDCLNYDFNIPFEFWDEWERLKNENS